MELEHLMDHLHALEVDEALIRQIEEEIAQHARQVIWMTPEPKWEVVRTVEGLANVAEDLGKIRS